MCISEPVDASSSEESYIDSTHVKSILESICSSSRERRPSSKMQIQQP